MAGEENQLINCTIHDLIRLSGLYVMAGYHLGTPATVF